MSIYKNLLKHSSVYSISVVFSKLASVLLLPIYTRYLTPSDYGVMELLDLTTSVVTILVGIHLSDAFLYYYSAEGTTAGRDRILTTAFLGATGVAVFIAAPIWFLAPRLSELVLQTSRYGGLFRLTFFSLIFLFPQEVATGYLRFKNQSGVLVKLQITRLCISIFLNVLLLAYFRLGIAAMLYGQLAGNIFMMCAAAYHGLKGVRWRWDYGVFFQLLRYSLPIGFSGLAVLVVNFGDRFLLQRNVGPAELGIYSLAYKMGMLVGHLQGVFCMYWMSQMFVVMKQENGNRIFARLTTYYTLTLACGAMALSVFAYPIVRLLAKSSYIDAAAYIPMVASAYLIKAFGDHLRSLALVEKRPGVDTRVTFTGSAVCLLGYLFLIPRFRLHGAIAATIIAFVVMGCHSLWEVRRLRPVTLEWGRLGIVAAAFVAALASASLVRPDELLLSVAVGLGASALFVVVLIGARLFYEHEIRSLRTLLSSFLKPSRRTAETA